jgi:hypothetical protein
MLEKLLCEPWFLIPAGAAFGAGIMIIILAKWGSKWFSPPVLQTNGENKRLWESLTRIEEKLDFWLREHSACQKWQLENFVKVDDFRDWKTGRTEIWEAFNHHTHGPTTGKVER